MLITADDVAHPKPAPDIYLAACSGLGCRPRSAALEDSQPGISSARAAGLFVIGVPYFEDQTLEGASLMAPSLADPAWARRWDWGLDADHRAQLGADGGAPRRRPRNP